MSAELGLPIFKTFDNNHNFHLIRLIRERIFCWEELQPCELQSQLLLPENVRGGQTELQRLKIWDKLSPETQERVLKTVTTLENIPKDVETNSEPATKRGRGRPKKTVEEEIDPVDDLDNYLDNDLDNLETPVVVSSEPVVKRGRGRPRKII